MNFNTTNQILNISWTAEDEDGDSLTFDVQIFEDEMLAQEELEITTNSVEGFTYSIGTSYSVKVTAKDIIGNFSVSEKTATALE